MRVAVHICFLLLPVSLLVALCSCGDPLTEPRRELQADTPGRWLELPATDTPGMVFIHHPMPEDHRLRNYSFYFDPKARVAAWVAYPLNNGLRGTGSRPDQEPWGLDPKVPTDAQAVVLYHGFSKNKIYDRGHQIPSADRQGTTSRNAATFYATNMTPQDYDFNSGIWAALEGSVRTLAKLSDTLYVVTGAVLGSRKTRDRDGHSITVPDAYFKALLFYGAGYGRFNNYSAAGIYMPHESTLSGSPGDFAMSIDELERKTGIQFFVNLPKKVGDETTNKLKAQAPNWLPSSWY